MARRQCSSVEPTPRPCAVHMADQQVAARQPELDLDRRMRLQGEHNVSAAPVVLEIDSRRIRPQRDRHHIEVRER